MDLSKLSPAPWVKNIGRSGIVTPERCYTGMTDADSEFIALARNAFDVMLRRGWFADADGVGKFVAAQNVAGLVDAVERRGARHWQDPFTALVEADTWYRENVEGRK